MGKEGKRCIVGRWGERERGRKIERRMKREIDRGESRVRPG